jgi:hypothetical protein
MEEELCSVENERRRQRTWAREVEWRASALSSTRAQGEVAHMREQHEGHAALLTCARSAMTRPLLKAFKM